MIVVSWSKWSNPRTTPDPDVIVATDRAIGPSQFRTLARANRSGTVSALL